MELRIFICFILIAGCAKVFAQQDNYRAWIEADTLSNDKKIVAKFVQNTNQEKRFRFKLIIEKSGANAASNIQSGTFTSTSGKTQHLSDAQLNLSTQDFFKALLLVYETGQLVAKDSFEYGNRQLVMAKSKPKTANVRSRDILEIDGLIIDETRSKTARDFYDFFYSKWIAPLGAKDFSIKIKELPSRGRIARISVEVNDQILYTSVLQPRLDAVEQVATQAINRVRNHLQKNESMKKELGNEDQQGSGIY